MEIDSRNDDAHESHLLDVLLGFGTLGALAGGLVTVLTLLPARVLVACHLGGTPNPGHLGDTLNPWLPGALPLALAMLTCCTSGVLLSGLAYLGRRAASGRLDHRVGRTLPLVFLLLVPMVAPWTRLVVAFPRFIEAGFAVSFLTGLVALASLWTFARTTNRVTSIFAAVNACEYGMLSTGLALAGGPVAIAGLAAATAAIGVALLMQLRGSLHPGVLGGTRTVPRVLIALLMVQALALSGLGVRAALAPEPQHVHSGRASHRGPPVLLRGAVVTVAPTPYGGCRPVDDEG